MPISSTSIAETGATTVTANSSAVQSKQLIKVTKRNKTRVKGLASRLSLSIEADDHQKNTSDYDNLSDSLERCFSDGCLSRNDFSKSDSTSPLHDIHRLDLDLDVITLGRLDKLKLEEAKRKFNSSNTDILNQAAHIALRQNSKDFISTPIECLDTDIYKLYRVVLEQTNLETWDNTDECSDENNKFTITCNQPFSQTTSPTHRNRNNFNLDFGQPDSWSNFTQIKVDKCVEADEDLLNTWVIMMIICNGTLCKIVMEPFYTIFFVKILN